MSKATPATAPSPVAFAPGGSRARITDFDSALEYLNSRISFEHSGPAHFPQDAFRLDRMVALLERLGDPHRNIRTIHVAGSKGKGSTVEMIAACLGASGHAPGVYTSPHLVHVRERIRIGASEINPAEFARLARAVAEAEAELPESAGRLTYFEALTALAFRYFADEAVDAAVIEVGLGGRLDSTNVIVPEVCAITEIQLEHTQVLGDTLAKIAFEKAGIMKRAVPCYTVPQAPEVMEVFKARAEEVGCPLFVLGESVEYSYRFGSAPGRGPHVKVSILSPRGNLEHMPVPFKGHHQAHNCGLALAVIDRLRERGYDASERTVAQGLERTQVAGRMETVWTEPRIIIDGAHTPESIEALVKAIGAHHRYDSMVAVFGCAGDKNIDAMLDRLALGADKVIFTRAEGSGRAADPHDLLKRFSERGGKMCQVAGSVKEAINLAARAVDRGDIICVTGSFYIAGEAKRLLAEAKAGKR
ncbi:MAG: bifunctional folylpolyglutamate synthase/dihydrofolate synthase [Phycisphaerales bacterium]|nr:bifunctional folylpolyglutamate synthase/dihydrofolate synthase [Phycisphaerales bacterium]